MARHAKCSMIGGPSWTAERIHRVETAELTCTYPRTVGKNARLGSHGGGPTAPIALISTESGAVGWGLLGARPDDLPDIAGRRLADLFDPDHGVLTADALPFDFALHDLAGILLGRPVFALLGSTGIRSVPCYDGAIYMDDLDPEDAPRGVEVVLRHCAHDYALGYRAFKLKIGRGHRWMEQQSGLRRDVEITRAVRERYPGCDLLVDANDGYDVESLLEYLDAVADCRLFWIEEPFPETREELRRLRRFLDRRSPETLIADGEAHPHLPLLLDLARDKLLDVLLMDIAGFGLTPWRRVMPELEQIGVRASPHAWGLPLKTLYVAHVAAGLGNVVTVEGVPGIAAAIDTTGYRLEEGQLSLPDRPGWGIHPPSSGSRSSCQ